MHIRFQCLRNEFTDYTDLQYYDFGDPAFSPKMPADLHHYVTHMFRCHTSLPNRHWLQLYTTALCPGTLVKLCPLLSSGISTLASPFRSQLALTHSFRCGVHSTTLPHVMR